MHDSNDEANIKDIRLNRFIEYAQSPDTYLRNLVGSTALETLPLVASSPKDVATVLELLSTVAVDTEVDVRCNILGCIVHVALMLSDPNKSCETLRSFITSHILPIIVTALLDVDPKVVKLADSALIALLEHCLVPNGYVQERIWPAIVKNMYDHPSTEPIVRVITLMSKMVPWVLCETTVTLFVPLFVQLCTYPDIIPRKACASIIGDFCAVVPLETVENKLVPSFLTLCGDSMWVVRKACAEVFTSVSSAASAYTRKHHLAPAFANLLTDPMQYVSSAAFQSLGPFITTFAEPSITNLGYNHQGKLVLRHPDGFEFQLNANIELNTTERQSISESSEHNSFNLICRDDDDEDDDDEDEVKTIKQVMDDEDNVPLDNRESEQHEDSQQQPRHHQARKHLSFDLNQEKDSGNWEKDWSGESGESDNWNSQRMEKVEDNDNEKDVNDDSDNDVIKLDDNGSEVKSDENSDKNKHDENDDNKSECCDINKSNDNFDKSFSLESDNKEEEKEPEDDVFEETQESISKDGGDKLATESTDTKSEESSDDFNGFVFWRDPIPNIEIDAKLGSGEKKSNKLDWTLNFLEKTSNTDSSMPRKMYRKTFKKKLRSKSPVMPGSPSLIQSEDPTWKDFDSNVSPSDKYDFTKQKNQLFLAFIQHIEASNFIDVGSGSDGTDDRGASVVPDELINHFVSMSSPRQDKMQNELAHHCAYNLPAVALTLGPENWALIKQACNSLATDQQWRVRRIVASSIHELAVIVGTEVATEDLVPVFTGFIKDLDEVRIGALKHLANFLKLLKPGVRNTLLPRLAEFLITDYDWNWRFRAELAEQLLEIVNLFSPKDISIHLAPVAFTLLKDKVAHVRTIAVQLVVEMIGAISKEGVLVRSAVAELAEQFAHSSRWCRRQTFAHLCSALVERQALPLDMFARDILPHLLDLSWDKVANVRLSVARTLSRHIMALDVFSNPSSPHNEVVLIVIKRLQGDKDRDVKFFAQLPPQLDYSTSTSPQLPESSSIDSNRLEDSEEEYR